MDNHIPLYDIKNDFPKMAKAGDLAAKTLDYITDFVKPGVSTGELNDLCHAFITKHNAVPAPLHYRGFPKSICTSINHVVCHGIPSEHKKLKNGDIVNIDVTVILDGWYGDTSRMFYVGNRVNNHAKKLVEATYKALFIGIEQAKPGNHFGDIGAAIGEFAHDMGYGTVEEFCGHGIGTKFHHAPNVLHFGEWGSGAEIKPGMIFTIEPMFNQGTAECLTLADGWTAITRDRKLSAQFEHSIGITEDGPILFTQSPKGWTLPPYE